MRRRAHRARWLVAALGLAACTDPVDPPLRRNECTQPFECSADDRCDTELGICVRRNEAVVPYPVLLQIVPPATGGSLVSRTTSGPEMLTGRRTLPPLVVASAVTLSGQVHAPGDTRGLEAELVFAPRRTRTYLDAQTSVLTGDRGGGSIGYAAALEPNTEYDVLVRPLGDDATLVPPYTFSVTTGAAATQRDFDYPALAKFSGVLQDQSAQVQPDRKVLLRHKATGDIVSSLERTGTDGGFELEVPPSVLESLADHALEVALPGRDNEWRVTIAVDGSRLRNGGNVTLPVLPQPTLFSARVESARDGINSRDVNASVTFSSQFEVPAGMDRRGDLGWCLPASGREQTYRCSSTVRAPVEDSTVTVELYPGYYDIYVTPSDGASADRYATTAPFDASFPISAGPDGGAFGGRVLTIARAETYPGLAKDELQNRMPSVRVTAYALRLVHELPEIARYNRTVEALSDRRGNFDLAVDTGYYDVIGMPPEGSGYATYAYPNRVVARSGTGTSQVRAPFPVTLRAPVIVSGRLVTEQDAAVPEARIDAYAIVPALESAGSTRALLIGTATSGDAGTFILQLPPLIDDQTTEASDGGVTPRGMDAGIDAGL